MGTNYLYLMPKQFDCLIICAGDAIFVLIPAGCGKSLIYKLLPYFGKVCYKDIGYNHDKHVVIVITYNST
jgi:hypothetical protein